MINSRSSSSFHYLLACLAGFVPVLLVAGGVLCNQASGQAKKGGKTEKPKAGAKPAAEPAEEPAQEPAESEPDPAGQQWTELPVDESQKRNQSTVVMRILRSPKFGSADEQDMLEKYYRNYFLPRWTLNDNRRELPKERTVLLNHIRGASSGEAYDRLNALLLGDMEKFAGNANFHPAVRVNAALLIGELTAAPPSPTGPPEPHPDAVPVLIRLVENPQQIDAVRVAAMVGLVRHAQFGLREPSARSQVGALVLKLLQTPEGEGNLPVSRIWMQAQTAEILGHMRAAGNAGSVAKALAAAMVGTRNPMSVRCAAAGALGQLDYAGMAEALNASQFSAALGQLAVDAVGAESRAFARRRLTTRLSAIATGLSGIIGLSKGTPHQDAAAKIQKLVSDMLAMCNDKSVDDDTLAEQVQGLSDKLEKMIKAPATP